jgi:hypothetical protein
MRGARHEGQRTGRRHGRDAPAAVTPDANGRRVILRTDELAVMFSDTAGCPAGNGRLAMLRSVLVLWILVIASAPAAAQVRDLISVNGWRAYIASTPSGGELCGMGTNANANGRFFWIKVQRVRGDLVGFIQVGDRAWSVPRDARGRILVAIDQRSAELRYTGTRRPTMIEASYRGAHANFVNFVRAFAQGQRMRISFPGGSIRPWSADLRGTERVTRAFIACSGRI